jgi:hypothetical protein
MEFTIEERLQNADELLKQYFSLILKTIIDIAELLEKRKEIIKEKDK